MSNLAFLSEVGCHAGIQSAVKSEVGICSSENTYIATLVL